MCNYAVNSITFSSRNSKLIRELHHKVLRCFDSAAQGKNLVKDLMKSHGYLLPLGVNNRDHFSACDELITNKKGTYYFQCETTTAWNDNMFPIITLLKEKYHNDIHLSFCTEDGNELLLVKDETGVFYPERFKVEWRIGDNDFEIEYFNTYREMFEYLRDSFPKAFFSYYDSLEDIKNSIDRMYEDTAKEYCLCIHRFKEYNNEMANFLAQKGVA